MDVIGVLILAVSFLLLAAGYFMSIYSGIRHGSSWGLIMIFLPPIAQIAFILRHQLEAKRWRKLFVYSLIAFIAGIIMISYPDSGFLLIPIGIGVVVYKLKFKSKPLPGFGWLSGFGDSTINHEGIEFDPNRYYELAKRGVQFFSNWQGTTRVSLAQKAFSNPMVVHDIKQFDSKHFSGMLASSEGKPNWADERIQLFLDVMRKKYNLNDRTIIALLVYVNEEMNYQSYASNFQGIDPSDYTGLMREIVLYDIYSEQDPNFRHVRRLMDELGISQKQARRVEIQYGVIKKELKVSHFAKSLDEDDDTPYMGVEKQIKSEIQLAAISARIGALLDISPTNYHIVGRDYSRDSRIDNFYRQHFSYVLSRAFNGHCCKCGEGMGQLEFDHFWLPKSSGGNFLMRSKSSGLYVNNCIPLCRSCNSSKGYRDFREFFTEEEIEDIVKRSQSIETYINQHMVDFVDPDFPNRAY
ncbi:MAG: hypothetical protein ACP5J4_09530 [Anaerolineae bacterium]